MPQVFSFDAYTWDATRRRADFFYSVDSGERWVETLIFPRARVRVPEEAWEDVLFHLHLMLGISYWKTNCPADIQVHSGTLSRDQARFWNTVYQKGLGEFFYRNKLLGNVRIRFPYGKSSRRALAQQRMSNRALVQLGGGKDSLTSIALLKRMKKDFETYSLGSYTLLSRQVRSCELKHQTVTRTLDSKLRTNHSYLYNGHVPVSAIYAWVGVALALRSGDAWVIASNERSANSGNLTYAGIRVNHQWSKSMEFERLFSDYVHRYISGHVTYFSLLRPFYELQIATLFAKFFPYVPIFSSCNRNFRLLGWRGSLWCGACAKCAFVYLTLAPFVEKQQLIRMFGANLLDRSSLIPIYQQLLGIREHKPFDCVGVPMEVRAAFGAVVQNHTYDGDAVMNALDPYLRRVQSRYAQDWKRTMRPSSRHRIPKFFRSQLYDHR